MVACRPQEKFNPQDITITLTDFSNLRINLIETSNSLGYILKENNNLFIKLVKQYQNSGYCTINGYKEINKILINKNNDFLTNEINKFPLYSPIINWNDKQAAIHFFNLTSERFHLNKNFECCYLITDSYNKQAVPTDNPEITACYRGCYYADSLGREELEEQINAMPDWIANWAGGKEKLLKDGGKLLSDINGKCQARCRKEYGGKGN